MASRATPLVNPYRRRALRAVRSLSRATAPTTSLIDPLLSTQELRDRIERVEPEAENATRVLIRPGHHWPGHSAGQYLRIAVVVDAVHHWRAYSLTADPDREDGCIEITPKLLEDGVVSPYLCDAPAPATWSDWGRRRRLRASRTAAGAHPLHLRRLRGHADSRHAAHPRRAGALADVVHLHSARHEGDVIFGRQLRAIASRHHALRLRTGSAARKAGSRRRARRSLPGLARARRLTCGPGEMLRAERALRRRR